MLRRHRRTVARSSAFKARFGGALTVIEEPKPGLSLARNVGAAAARGRFLVYLDDDAVPAKGCDSKWRSGEEGG